jgi:hypothetical protein
MRCPAYGFGRRHSANILQSNERTALNGSNQRSTLMKLQAHDAFGLQTLGALLDLEFDCLALIQSLVSLALDGRKMNENVLSGLALDESITLGRIEPLHCTLLFSHFSCS